MTVLNPPSNAVTQSTSLQHSTLHVNKPIQTRHPPHPSEEDIRTAASSPLDLEPEALRDISFRVGIDLHRTSEGFSARANTLNSYLDLNRYVCLRGSHALISD